MTEERYFGWMVKSEGTERAFDIGIASDPLPSEVLEEFEEIVGAVCKLRPTLIDYKVLLDDYTAIERLPNELRQIFGDDALILLELGNKSVEMHSICERRLSAFLNAASALRDRALGRMTESGIDIKEFKEFLSSAYDKSFAYRLYYNLRNMSQHQGSPLWIIPINGEGEDGYLEFKFDLSFGRDDLMQRGRKFQSKLRKELPHCEEKIPLLSTAREYYAYLIGACAVSVVAQYPDFNRAVEYQKIVRRIHGNMPQNATPFIFHGKPVIQQGVQQNSSVTCFSFEEVNMIVRLLSEALEYGIELRKVVGNPSGEQTISESATE